MSTLLVSDAGLYSGTEVAEMLVQHLHGRGSRLAPRMKRSDAHELLAGLT